MTPLRCANGTSPARSFLQMVSRRYSAIAAPSPVPLDFLLPHDISVSRLRAAGTSPRPLARKRQCTRLALVCSSSLPGPAKRSFAVSATRNATRCVLNPQKDDDGNDMMLEITPRAAKRLTDIMKKDDNPNLALRIQVESGGCHGFQYLMRLVTIPAVDAQERSSVVNQDDSIFKYHPDDADPTSDQPEGPRIILDEPSLDLLKGSKVDFTMELIGSQFKIVDNPYATSSCGCGTSFDIKM